MSADQSTGKMSDEPVGRSYIERKNEIIDLQTPINAPLSAQYRRSFACYTIQQRLPTILTKIIDSVTRDKNEMIELFGGDVAKNEVKEVIAHISQMKYELQTNKDIRRFDGEEPDKALWNDQIEAYGERRTYCSTPWLFAECYLYRRIHSNFLKTTTLKEYDYFRKQKDAAFDGTLSTMTLIADQTAEFYRTHRCASTEQLQEFFLKLIRVNLWGNRCDLSISCGEDVQADDNPFNAIEALDESILANDSADIYDCLTAGSPRARVDFILDNAGYELFTDLVLADFLIRYDFATTVRFHCKAIPWFISDVMARDFHWTVERLANSESANVREFGRRVRGYVEQRQIELRPVELFWTSPFGYDAMQRSASELYADLAQSHLLIFKGDLNYRKLLGDLNWKSDTKFADVLQSFRPTNVCALRTIKADLICGVAVDVCANISDRNPKWMETGEYGVIQFAPKLQGNPC